MGLETRPPPYGAMAIALGWGLMACASGLATIVQQSPLDARLQVCAVTGQDASPLDSSLYFLEEVSRSHESAQISAALQGDSDSALVKVAITGPALEVRPESLWPEARANLAAWRGLGESDAKRPLPRSSSRIERANSRASQKLVGRKSAKRSGKTLRFARSGSGVNLEFFAGESLDIQLVKLLQRREIKFVVPSTTVTRAWSGIRGDYEGTRIRAVTSGATTVVVSVEVGGDWAFDRIVSTRTGAIAQFRRQPRTL